MEMKLKNRRYSYLKTVAKPVAVLALLFAMTSSALAWKNDFPYKSYNPNYAPQSGHQWLTKKAIELLKERGLWHSHISDDEIYYIYYGGYYPDAPWIGRPESPNSTETSLYGPEIKGKRYAEDYQKIFGSSRGAELIVSWKGRGVGSEGKWWYEDDKEEVHDEKTYDYRPNLYLEAKSRVDIEVLGDMPIFGDKVKVDERVSADNYFHFANKQNATDADGNPTDWNVVVEFPENRDAGENRAVRGYSVFENSDVGAILYGSILYNISRKFSEHNSFENPSFNDMIKAGPNAAIKTGNIHGALNDDIALGLIGDVFGTINAMDVGMPHTYLGGNPFTCQPDSPYFDVYADDHDGIQNNVNADPCRYGSPSWPLFVPEQSSRGSSSDELFFLDQLKESEKEKEQRSSLIYLGWSLHMVQDLANPTHSGGYTGRSHAETELEADLFMKGVWSPECPDETTYIEYDCGWDDTETCYRCYDPAQGATVYDSGENYAPHTWSYKFSMPENRVDQIFGIAGEKTRSEICRDLGIGGNDLEALQNVQTLYAEVRDSAYGKREQIYGRYTRKDVLESSLEEAVIASMKLLLCLDGDQSNEWLVPVITYSIF